ncbi:MAG TPA: retropepsin-like aspartic protease [Methylomirabilota bacterium]|nr:retropepsin-like aspartic protease [Methylomirabilota bacterium]
MAGTLVTRYALILAVASIALFVLALATTASAGPGWYLLRPLPLPGNPGDWIPLEFDLTPLSHWQRIKAYDTADACEAGKEAYLQDAIRKSALNAVRDGETPEDVSYFVRAIFSQCIASDDPRLIQPAEAPRASLPRGKETPNPRAQSFKLFDDSPTLARTAPPAHVIPYTPGRPIIATVRLNGHATARLILDTGADGSMVKPELLAAAGVDLSRPAARGKMSGVAGTVQVAYFTVDFEVAGHRARVPHVAAFYTDDSADGLLGRDFLDRFKVVMDPAAGTVTLTPK